MMSLNTHTCSCVFFRCSSPPPYANQSPATAPPLSRCQIVIQQQLGRGVYAGERLCGRIRLPFLANSEQLGVTCRLHLQLGRRARNK
ncbi:hypothetical protein FKM82_018432 [Ascaphus truei]